MHPAFANKRDDKASQRFLTRVPDSTLLEVQQAVAAATEAQSSWALTSFHQRRAKMLDLANLIQLNRNRIVS